jgi:LuxR family transcriptional regulator, transcriptional regulator of spore coat protein
LLTLNEKNILECIQYIALFIFEHPRLFCLFKHSAVTLSLAFTYYMVTIYTHPRGHSWRRQGGFKHLKENDFTHKPLLTKREREVFELLVQDKTTKEIAQELFISEKTVRNHISNAMQKLGVKGRSQAVVELLRMGELKL